jgi:hypothetical protein
MWNTPAWAHSWNRRCTAEPLPNCRGSAFHWHPVFRRYTMPAIARRFSNRDRPPRACDRGSGNQGSTYFHTSSGTSANLASIPSRDHAALRRATFQQVQGGALTATQRTSLPARMAIFGLRRAPQSDASRRPDRSPNLLGPPTSHGTSARAPTEMSGLPKRSTRLRATSVASRPPVRSPNIP